MSSYGETEIYINHTLAGRIRVLDLSADSAIFPRLKLSLGCALIANPSSSEQPLFSGIEMRDLAGELRLAEYGEVVGKVEWIGEKQRIRAHPAALEIHFPGLCDLDFFRIETIERRRNGGEPVFYLQVWPVLAGPGGFYDATCRIIRMTVPRERWLQTLNQLHFDNRMIVEIDVAKDGGGEFRRACQHLETARQKIDIGSFDDAVASCRRAIDALARVLPRVAKNEEPVKKFVEPLLNEHRGDAYGSAARLVRRFGSSAAHDYDPLPMSRAEARLVFSTTANLISLLAELKGRQKS